MNNKIYFTVANSSFKKMQSFLNENNVNYSTQCILKESFTWKQFLEILAYTENGVEDILSTKSNEYKKMVQQGIDFEELTLKQFYNLTIKYPKIIKSPILVTKFNTLVGYSEEDITVVIKKSRTFLKIA